jgi:hypothetical protein
MALPPDGRAPLWHEFLPTDRWPLFPGSDRFVEGLLPPAEGREWRCLQALADGTLTCFDVATGRHAWTIRLESAVGPIVTGDLDGDGRTEALLGGADGSLTALRDAGDRGERLWRKRFPAPIGPLILADVDGDRRSEIILSTGDGKIRVLHGE